MSETVVETVPDLEYRDELPLNFSSRTADQEQAAAEVAAALFEQPVAPDVATPVVTAPSAPAPTQTAAPVVDDPFDVTQFEPQLTPDLESLLEDEADDVDLDPYVPPGEDELAEYEDDSVKALRKRNEFLETQLVKTNRGKWVAENLRSYPLVAQFAKGKIDAIDATSRRAFARAAAEINAEVSSIAIPILQEANRKIKEAGLAEGVTERQRVRDAWGTPAIDPAGVGAGAAQQEEINQALKTEDLSKVIKAMVKQAPPL